MWRVAELEKITAERLSHSLDVTLVVTLLIASLFSIIKLVNVRVVMSKSPLDVTQTQIVETQFKVHC